jgi:hypothetical protein
MQNPATILVSLYKGQEVLNIATRAVGLGNHKGLTDGTITVGRADKVTLNSDHQYRWNRKAKGDNQR